MKGKLVNKAGRLTLTNSVLTSITASYLTLCAPSKWIISIRLEEAFCGEEMKRPLEVYQLERQ